MKYWKQIFLNKPFFYAFSLVIIGFCLGFYFPEMILISQLILFAVVLITLFEVVLLFWTRKGVSAQRILQDKLSNSDSNPVEIHLENHFPFRIKYSLVDEIPNQFQIFDFKIKGVLGSRSSTQITYELIPKERGVYRFGDLNVFVATPLGFFQRRIQIPAQSEIKVYPSFLRLNQFSLHNFKAHINEIGQKKIRRIGHSMEFEQIKDYVAGDDFRTINWKSTAKNQKLMVNQYVDEKSQQVYCAIDKGRVMKMPFGGMSLLDYAINSSLVFSNVVLQNQDRAGVFTFSSQLENLVKAERRSTQLHKISESLYNIQSNFSETDFGKLYNSIKYKITQRGLIVLFTNFESMDSLHRQLPYLQGINKSHLLVVVFFRNTELEDFLLGQEDSDLYERTLVEKFIYEKQQIVLELNKYGIQTVLTRPEDLTVNTINKYLEIKSRGII